MRIVKTTKDNLVTSEAVIGVFMALGTLSLSLGAMIIWGIGGLFLGMGTSALFLFLSLVLEKCAAKIIQNRC